MVIFLQLFSKAKVIFSFLLLFLAGFCTTAFSQTIYVDPAGNDATADGSSAAPYATIQAAVNAAVAGSVIQVAPGTYAERVVVDKPLTIDGPNAGKAGDDAARTGEAKIIPPTTDFSATAPVVRFAAGSEGSVFDGFEVNGDNPTLAASGVVSNGVNVDAPYGILIDGTGDITIQNNVVQNFGSDGSTGPPYPYANGIIVQGVGVVSGIKITGNYIRNLNQESLTAPDLNGVMLFTNVYAQVTDNRIDNVRIGVQFVNNSAADPDAAVFPAKIDGNDISSYRAGIYYNNQYLNASPWMVSNNTLRSIAGPSLNTLYEGIRVESIQGAVDGSITGNTVIGNVADRKAENASYEVWGIGFKNNVNTTGNFLVKDNDISKVLDGIVYKTDNSAAQLTTNVKYEGGNIHDVQRDYVRYEIATGTTGVADVNLPGTKLDGKTGAEYTAAEVADIESQKIIDKEDNPLYGAVNFVFPVENINQGTYYATIQDAVDAADPNDEIKVPAGTYAERVVVDKPLKIEGPNMGKAGDDATRVAEAKIIPPSTEISGEGSDGLQLPMVKFGPGSAGSSFDGFEVNGDNPTLPSSGVDVSGAGISVDAAFGIRIEGVGDVAIQNNVVQNLGSKPISKFGYPYALGISAESMTPVSGILIARNYIKNMAQTDAVADLDAVMIIDNAYAQVRDNKIDAVRIGVQFENQGTANPQAASFPAMVNNNDISAYRAGIYYNLQHPNASPWTVSDNTLRSIKNPTGNAIYEGIRVENIEGAVDGTISNNTIIGNVADRMEEDGSSIVTGISFKNKVNTTGTFLVKDNDISGVLDGIVYKTDNSAAQLTTNVKYEGGNIHDVQRDYVRYEIASGTTGIADVNLPSTKLDGKTGAEYTASEVADIESQKIIDKEDNPLYGAVNFVFPVENVTQGTYYATIQDAVDAADPNDEIKVPAGTYAERVVVDKPLKIEGPNMGKAGNDAARVAEAKIIPPGTNFNSAGPLPVVKFEAGAKGSVFDGFEVNGDNPTLPTSGVIVNGLSVDAAFGIRIEDEGGITIENNLVQNFGSNETMPFAVAISVINTTGGKVTSGIVIKDNYIKNLNQSPALAILDGITIENNAYAQVTDNTIKNVREGIQFNNHYAANPDAAAFPAKIDGNDITSYRSGIYNNQQKNAASPWTVSHNTLQSMTGPLGNTMYEGIRVETITGTVDMTIDGNTITGNVADRKTEDASYGVWGIGFKNDVNTTGTFLVKDNDISGVENGIVYTTNDAAATLTAEIKYEGGDIHDITGDYVHYQLAAGTPSYADVNLPTTQLDGKTGGEYTATERADIKANRITDKDENSVFGSVNLFFPVENIMRGTFFVTIQDAIDDAETQDGDVINVGAGTYTLTTGINVTKSVILQGNNLNLSDKPLITGTGGTANKALFYVTAPNVTIRNFHLKFEEENANLAASVTSYGIRTGNSGTFNNLTIADNLIEGTAATYVFNSYGIYTGSSSGMASDKVTIQRNIIGHTVSGNALGRAIRTWHTYGVIGGSAAGKNTLKAHYASIQNGISGGGGVLDISYNMLQGKIEMNDLLPGTHKIRNNTITSGGNADAQGKTAADRQPALIEIISSTRSSASVEISGNTLNDFKMYGVAVFASSNVNVLNNIFNPLSGATDFAEVYFDTKTTNSDAESVKTYKSLLLKGNTFNGSGVAGGTGLEFANSNGAATTDPLTGIIIGGAGADANTFSGDLDTYISLSNNTGPSDGIDPWKPTSPYYSGTAITQAFPFSSDMDVSGNDFGGVDPETADNAALYNLETKINDGIDNGVNGLVTIKKKMAFPASAEETQNAFAIVPDENYTVLVKAGTDLSLTTLIATKDITLDAEDASVSMEQITMNGTGKTLTLNKPVTLTDSLVLKAGVVATTDMNILELTGNAYFSEPVKGAYIDGPVTKTKNGLDPSVTFPVGKNGLTAPIAISDVLPPVTYTVEYFKTGYSELNHDGMLTGVSHREYWRVSQDPVEYFHVTLYSFDPGFSGLSGPLDEVRVARYNGTEWTALGGNYTTGDPVTVKSTISSPPVTEAFFTFGGEISPQNFSKTNISHIELPADSIYKAGDALNFIVHFSTDVTVNTTGGKPELRVDLGSGTVSAGYVSSADDSVIFSYTVKDPDLDDDGITANDLSLDLGGATIKAGSDNADLTIQGINGGTGIQVDGVAPVITDVTIPNEPMKIGNTVTVTITTSTDADTYTLSGGEIAKSFPLSNLAKLDDTHYTATFTVGSGGVNYPAAAGIPVRNLMLMDGAGNKSDSYDNDISQDGDPLYAEVPVVFLVDNPADGSYKAGKDLDFTVHYSKNVTVTGLPLIGLTIGNEAKKAVYVSGGGSNVLVFRYTVQDGDLDADGITVTDHISGIITDDGGNAADPALAPAMDPTTAVLVDAVPPQVSSVSVPTDGLYKAGDELSFEVVFNEPVTVTGTDAVLNLVIGSSVREAVAVSSGGNSITFSYTVQAGELDADGIMINALSLNSTSVTDAALNSAATVLTNIAATAGVKVDAIVPVITAGQAFSIDENSAAGSEAGTAEATNAGAAEPLQGWTITAGNTGGAFAIDAATGKITVNNSSALDYETAASYTLTLTVSNGANTSAAETVVINLNNLNDEAPVITAGLSWNIDENTANGTDAGTVTAGDADGAATVFSNWTITAGNTGGAFAIDASTGKITVSNSAALDYETTPSYTLTLTVSDGVNASAAQTVTINLNDQPEAPSVINLAAEDLYENQPAGALAGTLKASSGDPDATVTYALVTGTGSDDNSMFTISGNELRTAAALNYEEQSSYSIRVSATTSGFSREQAFTINVGDVNEAPAFNLITDLKLCSFTELQGINLIGLSAGEDAGQSTSVTVSSDNDALFGSLTASGDKVQFSIKDGAAGTAKVTVTATDDGGTANGGINSFSRSFNLTVGALPDVTVTSDAGTTLSKGTTVHLTASGGTTYQWTAADGIVGGLTSAVLTVRPAQDATYHVTVTNADGCSADGEIALSVKDGDYTALSANNIFTPNGDGRNDTWTVRNLDLYPDNEVSVYDRSGRLIFHEKNYRNDWKGTLNGRPLHTGTYYYIVNVESGKKILKGFITIIRNE